MAEYQLYFHDHEGRIETVDRLRCANEAEAVALAHERLAGGPGELWQRSRRIQVFQADRRNG